MTKNCRVGMSTCGLALLLSSVSLAEVKPEIKICLAGASTVQSYKPGTGIAGWGQAIGSFFDESVVVENHAVGGRSTKTFTTEGRWAKLIASHPNYILIHFGHNDSHGPGKPESTDAATDYRDYLRTFIDDAKKAGAVPILVTPAHRRLFGKDGQPSRELTPYAEAMKIVAAEKGVMVVDLHTLSGELLQKLGEEGALDLYRDATDRSHFSEKGAETIASLIIADLKRQGSPLSAHILAVPRKNKPAVAVTAVPPMACLHVVGVRDNVTLSFDGGDEGVLGEYADWLKADREKRLIVRAPAGEVWSKTSFTFTPKSSGSVVLILMSDSNADNAIVCYDGLSATGAQIVNGDFEAADEKGGLAQWQPLGAPLYDGSAADAHDGKAYVKCSGKNRFNQTVKVEGGKPVTLSVWVRGDSREQGKAP